MIDKTLKILICFILFVPLLGTNVSAATNYDHDALMQYEGYGKAMYDSIVEQTTFITGQYTDNQEYVRDSMDQVKDYADFWYNEYNDFDVACNDGLMTCLGEMTERGGAYVLTVGDWVKNLFSDYDGEINSEIILDNEFHKQVFNHSGKSVVIKQPWFVEATFNGNTQRISYGNALTVEVPISGDNYIGVRLGSAFSRIELTSANEGIKNVSQSTIAGVLQTLTMVGVQMKFYEGTEERNPNNTVPIPQVGKMRDYVSNNPVDVVLPELKPRLVCPDGTQVAMSVTGTTFLSEQGKLMHVEKDGTATVNSVQCNLEWDKPEVGYVDDKASITDSTGNWLDIATGDVTACIDDSCKPKPLDNSLLDYVKNAYDYATSVLKNATDGLKSLATGAKDLTALFGTFFSWLPAEIVVLMTSGLGITIGLRLFRK